MDESFTVICDNTSHNFGITVPEEMLADVYNEDGDLISSGNKIKLVPNDDTISCSDTIAYVNNQVANAIHYP